MANRLSEIEDWNILLLEVGDGSIFYDIPAFSDSLQLTDIDWDYRVEPNENYCRGK